MTTLQRTMLWVIGLAASGMAWLGRLGGWYEGWNASLLGRLALPAGHGTLPMGIELVCAGLFAFGTVLIALQVTAEKFRAGLLLATLLQPLSATAVGALTGVWVPPFTWLVAIGAALTGAAGYRLSSAGKREKLLREVFGKNLAEASLARLLQQPQAPVRLTHLATVLSARFLGSEWSELEARAEEFKQQSAWVELQTGNRLLAVWNMPVEVGGAAEKAVESSLQMTGEWQVGIATGVVQGELLPGTERWKMQGAVFEKADALCQANATFGSRILLDLATADLAREAVVLRPVDFLVLPATELGVEIFEPLEVSETASAETVGRRDRFWEAVIFFRQKRFSEALAAFNQAGEDAVVQYYRRRLEKLTSSH